MISYASKGTDMQHFPYRSSIYEHQLASAILAHALRRDEAAVAVSLDLLAAPDTDYRLIGVLAAVLAEVQRSTDPAQSPAVARWFSNRAMALAASGSTPRKGGQQ